MGIAIGVLLLLLVVTILFVRSPWGQNIIIQKATSYVSKKTNTHVGIDRLFITFKGDIYLEGLYLEDLNADTLVYSKKLETGVAFWPLIKNGNIFVSKLEWEGLTANVRRDSVNEVFNFDFLMDAFISESEESKEFIEERDPNPFPQFSIGPVNLLDFDLKYDDQLMGIMANASWKKIHLNIDHLELNKMDFGIEEFLIEEANIFYLQSKVFPESEEPETSSELPLPLLVLDKLQIQKTNLDYQSVPDGLNSIVYLDDLILSLPEANLEEQKILLEAFSLTNSNISLKMEEVENVEEPIVVDEPSSGSFEWPDWWVEVGSIDLENIGFEYIQSGAQVKNGVFNPDAIQLQDFNFSVHSLSLKEKNAKVQVDQISFREGSGLLLDQFSTKFSITDQNLDIESFLLKTAKSELRADLVLNYQTLAEFIENPGNSDFNLSIKGLKTDGSEALYFAPELDQELYFQELLKNGIVANGQIEGNLKNLSIPTFDLEYGEHTSLNIVSAEMSNYLDSEKIQIDLTEMVFVTKAEVIDPFLEDLDYNIPEEIRLEAKAKGGLKGMIADVLLNTSDGDVAFKVDYKDNQTYFLNSTLALDQLDLGKIMNLPQLRPITLVTEINGSGTELSDLDGLISMDIDSLIWGNYDFSELGFSVEAKDGIAELDMGFQNEILDFDLDLKAKLDTVNPEFSFYLDLNKFRSAAFGVTRLDIDSRMKVSGSMEGSFDDFEAQLRIEEGIFIYDRMQYPLGKVELHAALAPESSEFQINSDFLVGDFHATGSVENISMSIENYLRELIAQEVAEEELPEITMKADFRFHPTPFIDQLLVAGIEELDTVYFDLLFDSKAQKLNSNVFISKVRYTDVELDTFRIDIRGDNSTLNLDAGFQNMVVGPVDMGETNILLEYENSILEFGFISRSDTTKVMQLFADFSFARDTLTFHVNPKGLILNSSDWAIPDGNLMTYAPKFLDFREFTFSREGQSLSFTNELNDIEAEHLGLIFKDFRLSTLLGFLNPDDPLVKGIANGEMIVENPFDAIGLLADLEIRELEVLEIPLGILALEAKAKTLEEYDFNLSLKDGGIDLDLVGTFVADSVSSNLDLDLDLNAFQMSLLETLTNGAVRDGKGIISGGIKVGGSVQEPDYKGEVFFTDAGFLISDFNTSFLLADEKINLDNSGFTFNKFNIKDANGNDFVIDGKVNTDDFTDVGFNLKLVTQNFQIMNSTRADNDLFFGRANVDMDMTVGGSMSLPEVIVRLKVNKESNITFIVPEDQLDVIERTGVVIFVNHEDPYDVLYQREMDISTKGVAGYDVKANLQVNPESVFNVIVDERTGDNLRLQGEADLNMLMNPNGDISLSGRYEVKSGHYELNLFGLVNRRFELREGSSVVWNGDPMDANLDLTAIYNIRTSPGELMQAQLSGTDGESRGQFRQVLNFMVYLKIGGELLKPDISFELDMSEQERGVFGGSVYGMIQQVNDQDDELVKQVFSLLVLNQFFPVMGNDGTSGGSVSLARSSVSQVLSTQLNALSDRLFGESGFSVDFDLDSFTDYQSGGPADRTQLNVAAQQRLMDDRLVISVGGQVDVEGGSQDVNQGDALFGDVSVEYMLDNRGQWRAKAFRKNQFESVIDGQLIVTGISLIFNKEFNAIKELWRKAPKQEAIIEEETDEREEIDIEEDKI
ncbi:translocation/assembly module TamB domain-containing protein [Aquiflexum sp.]|uniref:translocation/assembly module TamB domain-containing protein n=1 Tax=Aquiflexum sp. TaxID=1872584 RepID=UPI003593C376